MLVKYVVLLAVWGVWTVACLLELDSEGDTAPALVFAGVGLIGMLYSVVMIVGFWRGNV